MTVFTLICCKNCIDVCLKRPKINKKRPGLAHFFKKCAEKMKIKEKEARNGPIKNFYDCCRPVTDD